MRLMSFLTSTFSVLVYVDKERNGRQVEWVEKAWFDQLNKLFMISLLIMNHQTLLLAQNLLTVIREPQPYVPPIIPRRLLKIVLPGSIMS